MNKLILDLCGGTGNWSKPYKEAGYDVRLITLPDYDVRTYIPPDNVYGILAAPPCTEFAVSDIILNCNPHFWALENPVGRLKRLRYKILGEPRLVFHPYEYGDAYTKKTLLWGKFNIPIKNEVKPEYMISKNGYKYSPIARWFRSNEERRKTRSITPAGFAKAFFEANR